MNLVAALILFNILILVYQVIIEIFTILCRINGVSLEKSRFQVISLLTGTGFTTSESEVMLLTKKRRKLAQRIMLFSYIFNISIVSIFVNIFISSVNTTMTEVRVGIIFTLCNILLMIFINRSTTFRNILDKIVTSIVNRKKKKQDNFISIYDTYGKKVIAEIELKTIRDEFKNKTIEDIKLKNTYGIQLLVIKRKEDVISEIWPNTMIQEGDTIVVFGRMRDIKNTFIKHIINEKSSIKV